MESIVERVRLGLHYLDHNPDPAQGWMPYFGGRVTGPTPCYAHEEWDACDTGWRMVEAYILARQVLAIPTPGAAEQKLRAFVLGTLRDDGLSYRPDRPWCRPDAWMWDQGRALIALATWLRLEPSVEIASVARRMAEGLARIALREGGYWYYPAENWTGSRWGDCVLAHPPTGLTIEGLVDLAHLLGDERLLEMAARFVRAVLVRQPALFAEDGSLVPKGGGPHDFAFTHVHSRLGILLGLLKYALATGDRDLLAWGTRAYLYVKERLSSSFGWVPESLESGTDPGVRILSSRRRDEVCSISDMMQIAALLAGQDRPEERATIGAYGTNQIFAHQLVDLAPLRPFIGDNSQCVDTDCVSYRGMPERCLGGFTSGTYPNDLTVDLRSFGAEEHCVDAAGCCSNAGIKALWLLWRQAARREEEAVHLYLWASLENEDLAVDCAEPAAGRLHLRLLRPCADLAIHLPGYVPADCLSLDRGYSLQGNVLHLGAMAGGEAATLTYPLQERIRAEEIAGTRYWVRWRGGRVVGIEPPGSGCAPYWWRARYVGPTL